MKNYYFLLLLVFCNVFSQNKIEFTKAGIAPSVTEIENQTAEQLYLKTKEWIQRNYKNPSEVLKADIKNELIRIDGYSQGFCYVQVMGKTYYDVEYSIEFNFKDGKYRYSFINTRVTNKGQKLLFNLTSSFFKSDGITVKSMYIEGYDSYLQSVTSLYLSHYNYVTGKTEASKNDW